MLNGLVQLIEFGGIGSASGELVEYKKSKFWNFKYLLCEKGHMILSVYVIDYSLS